MKYTDIVKASKYAKIEAVVAHSKQDSVNKNHIIYSIAYEGDIYTFKVPIEDLSDATVLGNEKSIFLARWIRKAIEDGTFTKI